MNENYKEIAKLFYDDVKTELSETDLKHLAKFDRVVKEIATVRVSDKFADEALEMITLEIKKL